MFCRSSAVSAEAKGVMTEGAPSGPPRAGLDFSSLGAKSTNCLTRYSCGWLARLGLAGIVLLPAAPWQLAQDKMPRDISPLVYSCSPLAASGLATEIGRVSCRERVCQYV